MGLAKKLFLQVEMGKTTMAVAQKRLDRVFGGREVHEDSLFHLAEKRVKDNG